MKLPIIWLKDYVELPENLNTLTDRLTSIGYMQDHRPETIAGSVVLDLEVRQNRSDCLSVIGLARETAAAFGVGHKEPQIAAELPEVKAGIVIENKSPGQCYRFNSVSFSGIKVKESPQWLKDRLTAYGIKTINNIVDITNFVMVEYGEPLHVFNLPSIAGKKLTIRLARKGEELTVLGGKKIRLTEDDLVITDAEKIRGLAGVIGGAEEAVDERTTSILLEAATYNQAYIRRTSLRHSLRTEASLRHEKFMNPHICDIALRRAYGLVLELCGGKMIDHSESYDNLFPEKVVSLTLSAVEALGGITVTENKAVSILKSLGMGVTKADKAVFSVSIPYYRTDIEQEADLVEEILRIYGYDKISEHMPSTAVPKDIQSKALEFEEKIRDVLTSAGLSEQIMEPLTKEEHPVLPPIVLENSLNSEKTMLRTTLQHGLEYALDIQRKHRRSDVSLFEVGKIYFKDGSEYREERVVGMIFAGDAAAVSKVKGVVALLFERLERKYDDRMVKIIPLNTSQPAIYVEIPTEKLLAQPVVETVRVHTSIPQVVYEDISVAVPMSAKVGEMISAVRGISPYIYSVALGEDPRELEKGVTKSVFLKIRFSDAKRALESRDVEPIRTKIVKLLAEKFDAHLR